jgi:hypothetical protein
MKFRNVIVLFAMTALLPLASAFAAPEEGTKELLLSGGWFKATGQGGSDLTFDASAGYYFDSNWEAGLRQSFNYREQPGPDVWNGVTAGFIDLHPFCWGDTDRPIMPFIGAFIGPVYNDHDVTGLAGPEAGVKIYLSNDAFVGVRYRYEWFWDTLDLGNGNHESNNHVITMGVGWNWK